jgi:hypothetical protein
MTVLFLATNLNAQEELSPYFKLTDLNEDVETVSAKLRAAINEGGWDVIGEYHPAENADLTVICFTNEELKNLSLEFEDRGALAGVLKVATVRHNDTITVSILNPEYMFLAYWGEQLDGQEARLKSMSNGVIKLFSQFGKPVPFGGTVEAEDLPHYHYMMMMPYFDEPVELREFTSFQEGLEAIRSSLEANAGQTVKVYEQLFEGKEIAVFGIGLWTAEIGEGHFLPMVGESHIANMPYEIILQGNEATMLHGKYSIALFWPELKMGQFMKISSTPGDIEDIMENICRFD